jgi:hypothetical protein
MLVFLPWLDTALGGKKTYRELLELICLQFCMTVCWIVVQIFGLKFEELFAAILVFGLFYIHVFILDMLIQQISLVDCADELFWAL